MKEVVCKSCGRAGHYKTFCQYTRREPIKVYTSLPRATKKIKQVSVKQGDYHLWLETVARPALIERDGNTCCCCKRPAFDGEKLDIEHTLGKGSHPELKRDLNNMTLMCRFPCHRRKTDGLKCVH